MRYKSDYKIKIKRAGLPNETRKARFSNGKVLEITVSGSKINVSNLPQGTLTKHFKKVKKKGKK